MIQHPVEAGRSITELAERMEATQQAAGPSARACTRGVSFHNSPFPDDEKHRRPRSALAVRAIRERFLLLIQVGLLVIIGSVLAGYLLEQGNLLVLLQPAELVIIAGGALGIVLVSCPARNLRLLLRAVLSIRTRHACTRDSYIEALKVLYVLFQLGRGFQRAELEKHVETPAESEIFLAHPGLLADVDATNFICDSFRMALSAGLNADEVKHLMALDLDIQRAGR